MSDRASDLPTGSKVRNESGDLVAVRRNALSGGWWVEGLGWFQDHEIDDWIRAGYHAKVLRVGDGSGQ